MWDVLDVHMLNGCCVRAGVAPPAAAARGGFGGLWYFVYGWRPWAWCTASSEHSDHGRSASVLWGGRRRWGGGRPRARFIRMFYIDHG